MASKGEVNRAGDLLRGPLEPGAKRAAPIEEYADAFRVVAEFRKDHAYPLTMVSANLVHYAKKHGASSPGQRLKRTPTIIDKLRRQPGMKLARMQDIGGVRVVFPSLAALRAASEHIQRNWGRTERLHKKPYDYIAQPKDDGYRAVHLIVRQESRLIEVQLRTEVQHRWAESVETVDRLFPAVGLKAGKAPTDIKEYFRLAADLMDLADNGEPLDAATVEEFQRTSATIQERLREVGSEE